MGINENELLIGNILKCRERHIIVEALLKSSNWKVTDGNTGCTIALDDIDYIPIHENFLSSLGFKEQKNYENTWKATFSKGFYPNPIDIYAYLNKGEVSLLRIRQGRSNGFQLKIKYVHQFQNLYFALTGTELTGFTF